MDGETDTFHASCLEYPPSGESDRREFNNQKSRKTKMKKSGREKTWWKHQKKHLTFKKNQKHPKIQTSTDPKNEKIKTSKNMKKSRHQQIKQSNVVTSNFSCEPRTFCSTRKLRGEKSMICFPVRATTFAPLRSIGWCYIPFFGGSGFFPPTWRKNIHHQNENPYWLSPKFLNKISETTNTQTSY